MSTKTSSAIKDDGAHFVIVPATRQVTVPASHKAIGAVGDHLSEQLTFECPKVIDGYDIPMCARRYVTWLNVNGEIGHDELKDVKTENNKVFFTWTIRDRLTAAKGLVQFSIHFEDIAEDGETIKYRWGTATCKSCEILDSINASLGAYAAMYVSGDTLVIADYTPVAGDALALETPGIVPEGTLVITENGVHDVGAFASASVNVPSGIYPAGVKTIASNGDHDVTNFKTARVNVVLGETPTIDVDVDTRVITATANGVQETRQVTLVEGAALAGKKTTPCKIHVYSPPYGRPDQIKESKTVHLRMVYQTIEDTSDRQGLFSRAEIMSGGAEKKVCVGDVVAIQVLDTAQPVHFVTQVENITEGQTKASYNCDPVSDSAPGLLIVRITDENPVISIKLDEYVPFS